jgi:formylmethanofuran dehydrogenase subunit E
LKTLNELLVESAATHTHLCPRQVLGVRMAMYAGEWLGLDLPQADKRLFTIVESDGCFTDGIAVGTNCRVGRRTMRVEDFGKVAATFIDTATMYAVRVVPVDGIRARAWDYAPNSPDKWHAQLRAYQIMPEAELFVAQPVQLKIDLRQIISREHYRVKCEACGEEITNEREVVREGTVLCRPCAGQAYYEICDDLPLIESDVAGLETGG